LTKRKPRVITPGLLAKPVVLTRSVRNYRKPRILVGQESFGEEAVRRTADSNLRHLAGVSRAGACWRNPERSRET